jgi:hypothetical protein
MVRVFSRMVVTVFFVSSDPEIHATGAISRGEEVPRTRLEAAVLGHKSG